MPDAYKSFFKDKTVTLLGLGLLGRGVGDAAFLAQHCRHVIVTDIKSADDLRPSVDALAAYGNITFHLGGHHFDDFEGVDFIIKGAGVRLDNPFIAHAQAQQIPVYMSTALFTFLAGLKTIGITGTRGKTSTTCMIAEILKHAGTKVLLGGNMRGMSTLALLPDAPDYEVAVLELDSWQLQGFDTLGISPNISVFTTFFPDHMNYYDGDMQRYLHDKTAIYRHQKSDDVLITTADIIAYAQIKITDQVIAAPALPTSVTLGIPGEHNRTNAALARAAAIVYGIEPAMIDQALERFTGVEGRLHYLGQWQDRAFYNDNNATTQEATLAALNAFSPDKIVLIFGGSDKGLPIDRLVEKLTTDNIRGVLIQGAGSDRIRAHLPDLPVVTNMRDAVTTAAALSRPGDRVILSPAFASFGVFKNEYDRNDQFVAIVRELMSHQLASNS